MRNSKVKLGWWVGGGWFELRCITALRLGACQYFFSEYPGIRGGIESGVVIPLFQCKQYKHNLITTVNSNMQITTQVGFYLKPRIQFSTMWSYGFITVTLNKHSSNGRPTRGSYLKI